MQVISLKALRRFWERYPESRTPLQRWYRIVRRTRFQNFAAVRKSFPSADQVGRWIVFNVGGNNYRVIASIHFNRSKLYIRHVLPHAEYDRGDWKK
jgi:mRNA interferase HigB